MAARDNDRQDAHDHLDKARAIAERIGEDRDDYGTEFGPTNVALHDAGVAVELGDARQAIELAYHIKPEQLSPERQAGTTSTWHRRTPCDGRSAKC